VSRDEGHAGYALVRRDVIRGLCATALSAGLASGAGAAASALPIVRISRGTFARERYEAVRNRLSAAETTLVPAIRRLTGGLYYYAAIDRESSSMVNVSVWDSLDHAQQMQTLAAMQALAEDFTREGVRFERPVVNYETIWQIP